jgi:hypothetical protein
MPDTRWENTRVACPQAVSVQLRCGQANPATQMRHVDWPVKEVNVPAGHTVQLREPTVLDMVPMPHAVAAVKPIAPQYEPIGHIWPAEAPLSGQIIPTGQMILDVR